MKKRPQIGDVIRSSHFAFGEMDSGQLWVDGRYDDGLDRLLLYTGDGSRADLRKILGPTGKSVRKTGCGTRTDNINRAFAEYIVEEAHEDGSGMVGHGEGFQPGGWFVKARQLRKDGSYSPHKETINFFVSGGMLHEIDPKNIILIRRMKRTFK